ncbi:MAG TPA: hypothetical protein VH597_00585 [Verrucomicrobiae bacterium]|nr:hypothetical protein [Verrucomicrobiae bacterium]
MLTAELIVAMAILVIAVLPIGYSLIVETRFLKANYQHVVAMEIVDGEMEILAAGEWRSAPEGAHPYPIHALAATNLPPGQFQLTRTGNHLRLEWNPNQPRGIGDVVREVTLK